MVDSTLIARHLGCVLDDATIPELPNHYRGKVRDNYDLPDGRRVIIASDRLSAFDINIAAIPFKGQVLTQTARFWFDKTADLCPNHVLDYPDPNVVVCKRLDILPVEIVVRDYLAGTTATSVWSMYKAGQREVYGVKLPVADPKHCDVRRRRPPHRSQAAMLAAQLPATIKSAREEKNSGPLMKSGTINTTSFTR